MWKKSLWAGLLGAALPVSSLYAQAPTPITITVTRSSEAPPVSIILKDRNARAVPTRACLNHTGGGNIDVQQPSPDTIVVTMTGTAVAYGGPMGAATAGWNIDLEQCFEISFDDPKVKKAKLTIEGRVVGLLRSSCKGGGSAGFSAATASIAVNHSDLVAINVPGKSVSSGENLSVNDQAGPVSVPVQAGTYTLNQTFQISTCQPRCILPCKAPSAEFAPDPALDPLWISNWEPFKGASKKDFGFQVTVRVAADSSDDTKPEGNAAAPLPKGAEAERNAEIQP
ncbi:MAG: hypothetical protein NZ700_02875 [Gemmataceae bacterium]|nr:hypothetical protein [Gemmataceae bacterium]MDW8265733.1 hypothetical protein [Gemmataceae bacterium]